MRAKHFVLLQVGGSTCWIATKMTGSPTRPRVNTECTINMFSCLTVWRCYLLTAVSKQAGDSVPRLRLLPDSTENDTKTERERRVWDCEGRPSPLRWPLFDFVYGGISFLSFFTRWRCYRVAVGPSSVTRHHQSSPSIMCVNVNKH